MNSFSLDHYRHLLTQITDAINNNPLNQALEDTLNHHFPPGGDTFKPIEAACHAGIKDSVLCQREAGGIRYGRVFEASEEMQGYSVDLVHMSPVVGPHHRHPNGEIDMIMPIDANATFDQRGAGWLVYDPDSAHSPTVAGGEALILYLLPDGRIEFTR